MSFFIFEWLSSVIIKIFGFVIFFYLEGREMCVYIDRCKYRERERDRVIELLKFLFDTYIFSLFDD